MKKIALTSGKFALVDDEYYDKLNTHKWLYSKLGYAARYDYSAQPRRYVLMHREVISARPGQIVDHINRNRLDNTSSNLRIVTRSQNASNTNRIVKGCSYFKPYDKWMARITTNGKTKFLGYFSTQEEATAAYIKEKQQW